MKKWGVVLVCVCVIAVVLGVQVASFAVIKDSVEDVSSSATNILHDVSALSLFGYVVVDFFQGADDFEVRVVTYTNADGEANGHFAILYKSYNIVIKNGEAWNETIREEQFDLSKKGSGRDFDWAYSVYERMTYPIRPIIDREPVTYEGLFAEALEALQFIAYILSMIYGVICIIILIVFDTVVSAFELIKCAFKIIGLT